MADEDVAPVFRLALRLVGLAVLLILCWELRDVLVLFFGAVIVTGVLRVLSEPLATQWKWSPRLAVAVVAVALVLLLAALLWGVGSPLSQQFYELRETLPKARDALMAWLNSNLLGRKLIEYWNDLRGNDLPWSSLASAASMALDAVTGSVLMLLMGLYLALDPDLYKRGFVRLFPVRQRPTIRAALDASGTGLSRWLLGQALAMLIVGAFTAVSLALVGMPLAIPLGLIAGLLEFVPFFGPVVSGLIAVLFAFVKGPTMALYVAVTMLVIQQVEGNVIIPFIQRWAVHLPPVLGLLAVVVFGTLFGPVGVVFGTPLMVALTILVQKLYVDAVLEGGIGAESAE